MVAFLFRHHMNSPTSRSLWKGAALNLRLSHIMYHSVLSLYQTKIF